MNAARRLAYGTAMLTLGGVFGFASAPSYVGILTVSLLFEAGAVFLFSGVVRRVAGGKRVLAVLGLVAAAVVAAQALGRLAWG